MNPDTQSRSMLAHDGRQNADLVHDGFRDVETRFMGGRFGKKGPGREVERAPGTPERDSFAHASLVIQRTALARIAGRAVGDQQVVVQTILAQRIDQLARCRGRQRDDVSDLRRGRQAAARRG